MTAIQKCAVTGKETDLLVEHVDVPVNENLRFRVIALARTGKDTFAQAPIGADGVALIQRAIAGVKGAKA